MMGVAERDAVKGSTSPAPAGRKRRERNPDKTRRRVLDAARIEFAEKGFNGARIEAIASRSRSNVQAIYHYFNGKDGLYTAVLAEFYSEDWLFSEWKDLDNLQPDEAISLLLACLSKKYLNDTAFAAFLADQNSIKARHMRELQEIKAFYARLMKALSRVLKRGQRMGMFRKDIDAQLFYIMSVSAIGGPAIGKYTFAEAFGHAVPDDSMMKDWVARMSEMLLRGLRPD